MNRQRQAEPEGAAVVRCAGDIEAAARRGDGAASRAALAQLLVLDELHAAPGTTLPAE